MYVMTICYFSGQSQDFIYGDDAEGAKANFAKLQTAITQYQRFKNDTSESVFLDGPLGVSVFRTEHLVSVALSDLKQCESEQCELAAFQGRMLAARDAARASSSALPDDRSVSTRTLGRGEP